MTAQPALEITRVAPPLATLSAETIAAQHEGDFVLAGLGDSMLPVYAQGTLVVVHPTSYFMLRRGMAVVYLNHYGRRVAHLLVEETDAGWTARGLNNPELDEDRVTTANLVGLIRCAFVPDDRQVSPRQGNAFAYSATDLLH